MQSIGAEPVVSNTNSRNRRSHNTAEPINCISKVLHVLTLGCVMKIPRPLEEQQKQGPVNLRSCIAPSPTRTNN
jgi:hypothetical protein